jgi:sulfite exporter TauE/SafE
MCGGINLSQCVRRPERDRGGAARTAGDRLDGDRRKDSRLTALRPALLYNLGRVASYTVVGGAVGALGSAVSLPGGFKGAVQLVAGVFMLILGVNMLGLFPSLRRLNPRLPQIFSRGVDAKMDGSRSPLYVGLLNGLMPCGPLQAMQLYALSAGSLTGGALSMLFFSLGTVPLMFGLGSLSAVLSRRFTQKVMAVGAVLVAALGLSMFSNGWSLSGLPSPAALMAGPETVQAEAAPIVVENGVQIVNSTLRPGGYPAITVREGLPVRWTIDAPKGSINGCNNRIIIPAYNIEHQFRTGENLIEFTPEETGRFPYSCWMGMIRGSITVVGGEE